METEGKMEVTRGWEEGAGGSYCLRSTEFLLGITKSFGYNRWWLHNIMNPFNALFVHF